MTTQMSRRFGTALCVSAMAATTLLGACGDDDDAESGASIVAEASEYDFGQDSWTVPAGQSFTLDFLNNGDLAHDWHVVALGEDVSDEAAIDGTTFVAVVEQLPSGESTTSDFTIDESGTYQVICTVPGHLDAGMEASLVVE